MGKQETEIEATAEVRIEDNRIVITVEEPGMNGSEDVAGEQEQQRCHDPYCDGYEGHEGPHFQWQME